MGDVGSVLRTRGTGPHDRGHDGRPPADRRTVRDPGRAHLTGPSPLHPDDLGLNAAQRHRVQDHVCGLAWRRQDGFDGLADAECAGRGLVVEACRDSPIGRDEELLEVPPDVAGVAVLVGDVDHRLIDRIPVRRR